MTSNGATIDGRVRLHDGWTVRPVGGPVPGPLAGRDVPATVPGCVHTDLLAAGDIADPFLDDNERKLAWIGSCDWEYRTRFTWSPDGHDRHDLVFEGLDTVATVTLNGRELARTANQHRTYRLPVDDVLRPGENELVAAFTSPVKHADRQSLALGYRPHTNHHPYNAIRKMACNFGWDWGIDAATVGIWRPVTLHAWSGVRLAAVRPVATVDEDDTGRVEVGVELEWADDAAGRDPAAGAGADAEAEVAVDVDGVTRRVRVASGRSEAVAEVELPGVRRWWPRGHGAQPLYDVTVTVGDGARVSDDWRGRVGFRTVRLDMTPDDQGTPFVVVVNDRPVFVRGANWIPDDAFVHRVSARQYAERLDQAEWANVNLVRVWGGGLYESDDFYSRCDELGIMTWQDFPFACAAYAEEEPLRGEVEAEARDNVTRLLPHPSLVLWCGNNENIWGFHDWRWEPRLRGRTWGLGYYTELLPRLLAELDPQRPYVPGSPWSGTLDVHPNDPDHGAVHLWDLWNQRDYPDYRAYRPRFVAEFGWQGPPTWSTLRRAISDDPLTPESPGMIVHQKASNGNDKLTDGLVRHLPLPDDMDDWHWAMSLNQAVAVGVAVEHLRSLGPRCAGSVVWQLNDCWPVTSWSAVDGDGRPKPLLYALKHAYADRLLTLQPRSPLPVAGRGASLPASTGSGADGLALAIVNDSPQAWTGDVVLRRLSYDGAELATVTVPVDVAARSTDTLDVPGDVASVADVNGELVLATLGGERAWWFFAEYRDSELSSPDLRAGAERVDGGYRVHVTARGLTRDVALLADRVHPDARVDDMKVTLLPGERVSFFVTAPDGLDPAAFTAPTVLRSANDLLD
ncbi:beta-mannosidase [Haloactinopolyspora alba]|uniref:beta-mannosidase n=1 Tax=Haloactinopolyspora alba TaxID=648780 RepID=A0A2P8E1A1_9ACTN|nr:hypothetical protein [Haloactinopolyspora alba]PSL03245.1 beta-mannosidase [Haloactinopolyspora alba]